MCVSTGGPSNPAVMGPKKNKEKRGSGSDLEYISDKANIEATNDVKL